MEIGTLQAPQHGPVGGKPGQNPGQKRRRHGAFLALGPGTPELMQRAQGQAAPGQAGVNGSHLERQGRGSLPAGFQRRQLLPQRCDLRAFSFYHETTRCCSFFVPYNAESQAPVPPSSLLPLGFMPR